MSPPVVLVVDDDLDLRDALTDVLTDAGYRVQTAADGLEALDRLHNAPPPALILLDWMMPRCNGAQFRQVQSATDALAQIPVVILSADEKLIGKGDALGVAACLTKPVPLKLLLETIGKVCGPPG